MFEFANALADHRGFNIYLENKPIFINVDLLFVADLKMLPMIFAVDHSSSTTFCPICLVKRPDHRKENSSGRVRELNESSLLRIPVQNIVCPPLHLIQGATNHIFANMDKEKLKFCK